MVKVKLKLLVIDIILLKDYTKPWAMGAITVASMGAFTTVLCTVAIIAFWNTTIMR